jgi:putative ABC transport system substrate-binding protein
MASHIGRRKFLATLGGAAASCPLAARAQQPTLPVVGYLGSSSFEASAGRSLLWFKKGLGETGYAEDRNVRIEYRWADDKYERLPDLAMELVHRRVAVLVAGGSPVALPAKAATSDIPVIFMVGLDPVEIGLVASLNHPGGNLTGVSYLNAEVAPKRLELLHELVPTARSIALLVNTANPVAAGAEAKALQAVVSALGLHLLVVNASNALQIEDAFAALIQNRVEALQVGVDPLFGNHIDQLVALATRRKIPTIYAWREFTVAGGLMRYGSHIPDAFHQVGVYTGQILKGAKPADLPVRRPTKLRLVLNLKAAEAIGLNVPATVLARTDEVIE